MIQIFVMNQYENMQKLIFNKNIFVDYEYIYIYITHISTLEL